ncbi:MAG: helix-turn-helix transcriptional regulator [Kiritimatiellae bacterium]|nr:helix-turn-helix transcriptional regulator [Kiritimatiellia bacterium]
MLYETNLEMLQTLGRSLKAARLADNLSQQAVADRSGISLKAVRNIEGGKNASTLSLMAICKTLRLMDWIVDIAPLVLDDAYFDRPPERRRRLRAGVSRKGGAP